MSGTLEARPVIRLACLLVLLAGAGRSYGIGLSLGATAAAGQGFAYGSSIDARNAALAAYGAAGVGLPGKIRPDLFLAWSPGIFAELELLDWLSLRLEGRYAFLGAAFLASTTAGVPFDGWGASFASVVVPLMVRVRLAPGPVRFTAGLGPLLALPASGITVVDRYAGSTTSAAFPVAALQPMELGICGGLGLEIASGPSVLLLEVRTDVMLTSATLASGPVGGDFMPVPVYLAASYGFRIGGTAK